MVKVDNDARMRQLAAIAREVTDLPVGKQFRVLGAAGLRLEEVNWENCVSHPEWPILRIPTTADGKAIVNKA